ncbi:helix-turn-helix domain-containing protein [Streptococcus agalactiae]|uniref:helix-turn-helix domain-containing protein n=1 Tax=Streptococcus agalactiae TaxID=1311 RepID=UPI000D6ED434|nr:XRE family transcriptional regulator [Streptococcus agalactiae]PWT25429.1 XRE family transcriptional regulator [Streptococcus agalactiae]
MSENIEHNIFEISQRIKELRKQNNLEQMDVALKLGYKSDSTISKWENGKNLPNGKKLAQLAILFNTTTDFILNGKTTNDETISSNTIQYIFEKLDPDRQQALINFAEKQLNDQENNVISINDSRKRISAYIEGVVAAGDGTYQEDNLHMEVNLIEDEVPDKYDTIAQVVGDSMEPQIFNDDLLFIKVTSQVDPNEIGIFQINNKNFVKKLRRDYDGQYYLQSLNSKYDDIYFNEDDDIRTIGLVIDNYREV